MKKRRSLLIICSCLLLSLPIIAQQHTGLSGLVVNSEGAGAEFVNVALVQKINQQWKIVAFATSNSHGRFSFSASYPKGGYILQFSCMGYADCAYNIEIDGIINDLGTFAIQEGILLEEATVSARRQVVRSQVDRLVYDLSKDSLAARSSLLQILDKIPFIQIDPTTKQIKVMGQEQFIMTTNGKKSLLLSEGNQYVQEMLKAENLKEIELITSPDGQYSGQTVINFVVKSSLPDGIAAQINVSGNSDNVADGSFGITSKIGRLIFNLSGGYSYSNRWGSESEVKMTNFTTPDYRFLDSYVRNNPGVSNGYNAELKTSYDFNTQDLFTFQAKIAPSDGIADVFSRSRYVDVVGVPIREVIGNTQTSISNNQYLISLNHQHSFKKNPGRLLTFTYLYDNRIDELTQNMKELLNETIEHHTTHRNKVVNTEHTAAMDYYHPLSPLHSCYVTGKYVYRPYASEIWGFDKGAGNTEAPFDVLDYTQQLASAKANYSYRSAKWMVTAEATGEYTHNDIAFRSDNTSLTKVFFTWQAMLRLTYRPTNQSTIMFNVGRSAYRPDISRLNPYEDHSISGQITKGNPDLRTTNDYSAILRYSYFLNKSLNISLMAMCRYSDKVTYPYTYVNQEGLFVTTYANGGNQLRVGLAVSAEYNPFKWLQMRVNSSPAFHQFKYPENRNEYWDPFVMFDVNVNLWKGGSFSGQLQYANANRMIFIDMQSKKRHLLWMGSCYLSQNFGKNWRITSSISDPWDRYRISRTENGASDFYSYREDKTISRTLSLRATYTFGRFKENVKTSRRQVTNTDRNRE